MRAKEVVPVLSLGLLVCLVVAGTSVGQQAFPGDPFGGRDSSEHYLFQVFMRINSVPPCSLHKGIDVAGAENDTIFANVREPYRAWVQAAKGDSILLQPMGLMQNQMRVELRFYHIGELLVSPGDEVWAGDAVGLLDGGSHLHEELLLSPVMNVFSLEHLVNPISSGNEDAHWAQDCSSSKKLHSRVREIRLHISFPRLGSNTI
jgi:hypothetical protein